MKILPIQNNKFNFKAVYFEDYNSKYSDIRSKLKNEIEYFFRCHNNVTKIGEGVGGETFKFTNMGLNNLVIKTTKKNYTDNYSSEYRNLMSVPSDKIGGQEAVARVYEPSKEKYGLISTLVSGKPASISNRYNDSHLKNLFDKMFELDKSGIYHGDLNGNNILLNNSGNVNFIDYQWTQIVPQFNFYDKEKVSKMLLPQSVFPENAQMFEMASLPYYVEKLLTPFEKENFLKKYLKAKAEYHDKRARYIATLEPNWYHSEKHLIQRSLREERAKADVYKNADDTILKLELKKLQFLSDYRDAYSHVDANVPDRNIIPSSSSYLCAMSAIQDFRRDVARELKYCINYNKKQYLKSLEEYGDYWYNNLVSYTYDTFDYVIRAILNKPKFEEDKHRFYINERNPREISPNRDLLANVSSKFRTTYDKNFDVPANIYSMTDIYDNAAFCLSNNLGYDAKSMHNIDKIKSVSKESKRFNSDSRYLDLLNVSQVGVLKIREFCGYLRHNLSSYSALSTLNLLLEKSSDFTKDLFISIFNGLKQYNAENILVKGYPEMRRFKGKI